MGKRLGFGGGLATQFGAQAGKFGLQGLVFLGLALQVGAGHGQALVEAYGGEQVGELVELLPAALEVTELKVTFGEQGLEQEIGLAEADAEGSSNLPLAAMGVLFQQPQDAKVGVLLVVGAMGAGHGAAEGCEGAGTLPPYPVMLSIGQVGGRLVRCRGA